MSGTLSNIYNNVSFALYMHSKVMENLQEQASTGSRINRASDDPATSYRVLGLNSQDTSLKNYIDNLFGVTQTLEMACTTISNLATEFTETRTRITQITNGIYDEQGRLRIAEGINDILEQVVFLANTKYAEQYLFSGDDTNTAPYVAQYENDEIISVTYQGSSENQEVEVAPGLKSFSFYAGNDIFRSNNRGDLTFTGNTGAKAGTGTSNVTGDVWLTVTYDVDHYKLSIDDGETWVNVPAGGDTNQAVTDSTGKVLYVDSTEIDNTGVDKVSVTGTYNIFDTLISIRNTLRNDRGLSEIQLRDVLKDSLNSIEEIYNLMVQNEVSFGSKINFLDNLKNNLDNQKYVAEDEVTLLQQADVTQIAIDLSQREVLYQMSLSVAARLMSISLLDFME